MLAKKKNKLALHFISVYITLYHFYGTIVVQFVKISCNTYDIERSEYLLELLQNITEKKLS